MQTAFPPTPIFKYRHGAFEGHPCQPFVVLHQRHGGGEHMRASNSNLGALTVIVAATSQNRRKFDRRSALGIRHSEGADFSRLINT